VCAWLLIQAAVSILRRRPPAAPRPSGPGPCAYAARPGQARYVAVVALARRLAGILYALLRDGTVYAPAPAAAGPSTPCRCAFTHGSTPSDGTGLTGLSETELDFWTDCDKVHQQCMLMMGVVKPDGLSQVRRVGERECRLGRAAGPLRDGAPTLRIPSSPARPLAFDERENTRLTELARPTKATAHCIREQAAPEPQGGTHITTDNTAAASYRRHQRHDRTPAFLLPETGGTAPETAPATRRVVTGPELSARQRHGP